MAEVAPFHSERFAVTGIRLYHVCTECPIGRQIPPDRRRDGKGPEEHRLCSACESLKQSGKC